MCSLFRRLDLNSKSEAAEMERLRLEAEQRSRDEEKKRRAEEELRKKQEGNYKSEILYNYFSNKVCFFLSQTVLNS